MRPLGSVSASPFVTADAFWVIPFIPKVCPDSSHLLPWHRCFQPLTVTNKFFVDEKQPYLPRGMTSPMNGQQWMPVSQRSQTLPPPQGNSATPPSPVYVIFIFIFSFRESYLQNCDFISCSLSLVNISLWHVTSPSEFPLCKGWAVWTGAETGREAGIGRNEDSHPLASPTYHPANGRALLEKCKHKEGKLLRVIILFF